MQKKISIGTTGGLFLALFSIPFVSLLFWFAFGPPDHAVVVWRELTMFICGAVVLLIARRVDGFSWAELGLGSRSLVETTQVVVVGLVWFALSAWASYRLWGVLAQYSAPPVPVSGQPLWLLAVISLRAGVLEEFFYRAYAITRLEFLLGKRWLAALIPLFVFTLLHSTQGLRGILLALLAGTAFTLLYLWKRNLWANMLVHFLADYAPNALLVWYAV